ncbi:MAG: biotin/lipoyl-containing protein, partial [Vulcanimicrobiaceae bacterium]
MATTITMPQLGETVTEGTVERWLKKPGDAIDKYEAFVEVSTDKVNSEVPSPVTGTIRDFLIAEGTTVATGTPIAIIDEVAAASVNANAEPAAVSAPAPASTNSHPAAKRGLVQTGTPEQALRGASPAVRRLAREHQIDVSAIRGTGA